MKRGIRHWIFLMGCLGATVTGVFGDELRVGVGYGKQVGLTDFPQNNAVVDVIYDFHDMDWNNWRLTLGAGASWLWDDYDRHEVFIGSFMPTLRYFFSGSDDLKPYLFVSTGFSYMTEPRLGQQLLGGYFAFNDFFGVGTYVGREREWSVSVCWRHISNADLYMPNNGIDIPFYLMIGRRF